MTALLPWLAGGAGLAALVAAWLAVRYRAEARALRDLAASRGARSLELEARAEAERRQHAEELELSEMLRHQQDRQARQAHAETMARLEQIQASRRGASADVVADALDDFVRRMRGGQ